MKFWEAFTQLRKIAKRPRKYPKELFDEELAADAKPAQRSPTNRIKSKFKPQAELVPVAQLTKGRWHDHLTEAQQIFCKWLWKHCGRYTRGDYASWEDDFCRDYNVEHELMLWLDITVAAQAYLRRHPKEDKKIVIGTLVAISNGLIAPDAKDKRIQELLELWNDVPIDEANAVFDAICPNRNE